MAFSRVLWITDLFPHAGRPYMGRWLADLAATLSRRIDLLVLSPRYRFLWTPKGNFLEWYRGQPPRAVFDGAVAHYPVAPAVPAAFYMILQSASMAWSLLGAAQREHLRRPFDLVHAQPIIPGGVAAAWIARRLSLPLVLTGQGADVNEFPKIAHLAPAFRWACRRASRVTAVSADLVRGLDRLGFPGAVWIPNGCRVRPAPARERTRGRILFVGLLYERKAPEILIAAFARVRAQLPHASLDLVGEGPDRGRLEEQAARLGLSGSVRFHGGLPHERVLDMMELADVFCLPSRREGWPLVAVEALAAGLPIIGSDIGGIREIVRPELGRLVPAGNDEELARALIASLETSWDRARIRDEAAKFDWERIADRYVGVYEEAVAAYGRHSRISSFGPRPVGRG
ncbi:MAG: glycosyltransferase [Planctomycetes bacterium]|nr:glycosyltransferase [Planctomycetota bacterium]